MMDKVMIYKICRIEINEALLYDQINSKEHKDIENYFIMKCLTYCEHCDKEVKNDEWGEHTISENHLDLKHRECCKLCNVKYNTSINSMDDGILYEKGSQHQNSDLHRNYQDRLKFSSS